MTSCPGCYSEDDSEAGVESPGERDERSEGLWRKSTGCWRKGVNRGWLGAPREELSNTTHVGVRAAGQILSNEEGSRVMLNFCGTRAMGME